MSFSGSGEVFSRSIGPAVSFVQGSDSFKLLEQLVGQSFQTVLRADPKNSSARGIFLQGNFFPLSLPEELEFGSDIEVEVFSNAGQIELKVAVLPRSEQPASNLSGKFEQELIELIRKLEGLRQELPRQSAEENSTSQRRIDLSQFFAKLTSELSVSESEQEPLRQVIELLRKVSENAYSLSSADKDFLPKLFSSQLAQITNRVPELSEVLSESSSVDAIDSLVQRLQSISARLEQVHQPEQEQLFKFLSKLESLFRLKPNQDQPLLKELSREAERLLTALEKLEIDKSPKPRVELNTTYLQATEEAFLTSLDTLSEYFSSMPSAESLLNSMPKLLSIQQENEIQEQHKPNKQEFTRLLQDAMKRLDGFLSNLQMEVKAPPALEPLLRSLPRLEVFSRELFQSIEQEVSQQTYSRLLEAAEQIKNEIIQKAPRDLAPVQSLFSDLKIDIENARQQDSRPELRRVLLERAMLRLDSFFKELAIELEARPPLKPLLQAVKSLDSQIEQRKQSLTYDFSSKPGLKAKLDQSLRQDLKIIQAELKLLVSESSDKSISLPVSSRSATRTISKLLDSIETVEKQVLEVEIEDKSKMLALVQQLKIDTERFNRGVIKAPEYAERLKEALSKLLPQEGIGGKIAETLEPKSSTFEVPSKEFQTLTREIRTVLQQLEQAPVREFVDLNTKQDNIEEPRIKKFLQKTTKRHLKKCPRRRVKRISAFSEKTA